MKRRQDGSIALIVLLVLLVMAVVAIAGWTAWTRSGMNESASTQKEHPATAESPAAKGAEPEPSARGGQTYTSSAGYSFTHPSGWAVGQGVGQGTIRLTSPDFKAGSRYENGINTYHRGALIEIASSSGQDWPGVEYYLKERSLNLESSIKNPRKTTVAGIEAARYHEESVGPGKEVVIFHSGGRTYRIAYVDPNTPDYERYLPVYEQVLASFKISR